MGSTSLCLHLDWQETPERTGKGEGTWLWQLLTPAEPSSPHSHSLQPQLSGAEVALWLPMSLGHPGIAAAVDMSSLFAPIGLSRKGEGGSGREGEGRGQLSKEEKGVPKTGVWCAILICFMEFKEVLDCCSCDVVLTLQGIQHLGLWGTGAAELQWGKAGCENAIPPTLDPLLL